ncbi:MAG: hypothetical protein U1B84_31670, partial [Variovorax sp.]|nr:hypothetical protein [Variovorax sp.]
NFLVVCFAVGVAGALLGLWVFSHRLGKQLDAQRRALDSEREQTRQATRAELELLGQQQTAHHEAQRLAMVRWQADQDARRLAEWQALWPAPPTLLAKRGGPVAPPVATPPPPSLRPRAPPPAFVLHEDSEPRTEPISLALPAVARWEAEAAPERELTDEEIDALPPELPVATRVPGRKLPAPKGPVLRNL